VAFGPDHTVWNGDDGGVYHYTPSTHAVTDANGNLNITQFYFGFNEVGGTLLAGSQDNASATTSSSTLSAWTSLWSGDGGPSAITPNDKPVQFIESDSHLYVTTNSFAWKPSTIGSSRGGPVNGGATLRSPSVRVSRWKISGLGSCSGTARSTVSSTELAPRRR